jgi:exopolysaccharide biosynthesis polyprenyl glycosylphosphotransferase
MLDALAVAVAWSLALLQLKPGASRQPGLPLVIGAIVPIALAAVTLQHLYRARVCSVRSVETERLIRTAMVTVAAAWLVGHRFNVTVQDVAVGGGLTFMLMRASRSAFAGYLQAARRRGRFGRSVVLVGANEEAADLHRLLTQHPELGFHVVGYVGDPGASCVSGLPYLGRVEDTDSVVARAGATGVIVAATALGAGELNRIARDLNERSVHVHLSSGVRGIAQSRLRAQPLAYEPLFYVEPHRHGPAEEAVKRALDIVLAAVALVASLPVLVIAALAVKLGDGGPVFFRQPRVGRHGKHFTMIKLRTMVPDAETQYQRLAAGRTGRGGPLVKLQHDPRITRVGRILRSSSIDELPQLFNVLAGSMSMVGPRPNLLVEASGLDAEFLARKRAVRPGITGLWQIEGRDNPSFEVYRRLDLFYLENRSMGLDATILLATFRKVLGRSVNLLLPARLQTRLGASGVVGLQ